MKFSIITPTFNRSDLIGRTILSILNQTYVNFELIIVDDGSTDSTSEVVSKYLKDERIKYIKSPKNGGVNKARNEGLNNVSINSDWITFLDSDDIFHQDALENMKKSFEKNPNIEYFRFPVIHTNGKSACNLELVNTVADYKRYISIIDKCGEWAITFSKRILDDGFLFDDRVNGFETIAWIKLSKKENVFFDESFVRIYYTDMPGLSRSSQRKKSFFENHFKANSILLSESGDDIERYNIKLYISLLYEESILNIILGNKMAGIIIAYKAVKLDPFNINILRIFKNLLIKKI